MDNELINEIKKLYNKQSLLKDYGGQLFFSILIIVIFLIIFLYINFFNNTVNIKQNWEQERCNPLIMPFAGFINNTSKETKSNFEYTQDNFNHCLTNNSEAAWKYLSHDINDITQGISDINKDFSIIGGGIINFMSGLFSSLKIIIQNMISTILNFITINQYIIIKGTNIFQSFIGILILHVYFIIESFRGSLIQTLLMPIALILQWLVPQVISLMIGCITFNIYQQYTKLKLGTCILKDSLGTANLKAVKADNLQATGEALVSAIEYIIGSVDESLGWIPFAGPAIAAAGGAADVEGGVDDVAAGAASTQSSLGSAWAILKAGFKTFYCPIQQVILKIYNFMSLQWTIIKYVSLVIAISLYIFIINWVTAVLGDMSLANPPKKAQFKKGIYSGKASEFKKPLGGPGIGY